MFLLRKKSKTRICEEESKMSLLRKQSSIQAKDNYDKGFSKMKMDKETEQSIAQLQMLEQNMQATVMQKQSFQAQLLEIENALKELEGSKKEVFKIVGSLMIESSKEDLKKDLSNKKELFELRVSNLEKQEKKIKEKAEQLQAANFQ